LKKTAKKVLGKFKLLASGQSSVDFKIDVKKKNKDVVTIHWIVTSSDKTN
jgi:hypothetical protein